MLIKLMEQHARESANIPADWHLCSWEDYQREGLEAMKFEFMAAPLITRGKRKGRPNWRKADRSTLTVAWVRVDDHREWLKAYEATTGNCTHCAGDGMEFVSWHHVNGTTYQPCRECAGTRKALAHA